LQYNASAWIIPSIHKSLASAYLAATTANKMTMQRLANDITSKADLPGKKVRCSLYKLFLHRLFWAAVTPCALVDRDNL
jgi:hypothetical protein